MLVVSVAKYKSLATATQLIWWGVINCKRVVSLSGRQLPKYWCATDAEWSSQHLTQKTSSFSADISIHQHQPDDSSSHIPPWSEQDTWSSHVTGAATWLTWQFYHLYIGKKPCLTLTTPNTTSYFIWNNRLLWLQFFLLFFLLYQSITNTDILSLLVILFITVILLLSD